MVILYVVGKENAPPLNQPQNQPDELLCMEPPSKRLQQFQSSIRRPGSIAQPVYIMSDAYVLPSLRHNLLCVSCVPCVPSLFRARLCCVRCVCSV